MFGTLEWEDWRNNEKCFDKMTGERDERGQVRVLI